MARHLRVLALPNRGSVPHTSRFMGRLEGVSPIRRRGGNPMRKALHGTVSALALMLAAHEASMLKARGCNWYVTFPN
jgi:hypothetical protein